MNESISEKNMKALISMGYRILDQGVGNVWAKPVGYNIFTYSRPRKCLENYFKSNEAMHLYNSSDVNLEGDFLSQIKEFETSSKLLYGSSSFEFITIEQMVSL